MAAVTSRENTLYYQYRKAVMTSRENTLYYQYRKAVMTSQKRHLTLVSKPLDPTSVQTRIRSFSS